MNDSISNNCSMNTDIDAHSEHDHDNEKCIRDTFPDRRSSTVPEISERQVDPKRRSRPSREPVDRTSLEMKLDVLIAEMRDELAAEHATAAAVPGLAVYASGLCAPASRETSETAAPKIIVGISVDPRDEMTVVMRRALKSEDVVFDDAGDESPTIPILVPTGHDLPVKEAPAPARRIHRSVVAIAAVVVGLFLGLLVMTNVTTPAPLKLEASQPQLPLTDTPHDEKTLPIAPLPQPSAELARQMDERSTSNAPLETRDKKETLNPQRPKKQKAQKEASAPQPATSVRPSGRAAPAKTPRESSPTSRKPLETKRSF